jgi:hypothetical protein
VAAADAVVVSELLTNIWTFLKFQNRSRNATNPSTPGPLYMTAYSTSPWSFSAATTLSASVFVRLV